MNHPSLHQQIAESHVKRQQQLQLLDDMESTAFKIDKESQQRILSQIKQVKGYIRMAYTEYNIGIFVDSSQFIDLSSLEIILYYMNEIPTLQTIPINCIQFHFLDSSLPFSSTTQ